MSAMQHIDGLVDYFVICGLDEQIGLEIMDNIGVDDDLSKPPLERSYKANYIQHYPKAIDGNPLDKEAVRMLCLPSGLSFKITGDRRSPLYHSFIITHNDGSREFGYAVTFYEKVTNTDILIAMKTLYTMYQADLERPSLPKSGNSVSDQVKGHKRRLSALQINRSDLDFPSSNHQTFDIDVDGLYVSKCIALITSFQHVEAYRKIIEELFTGLFAGASDTTLPVETYIYHLLYEVPAPPAGHYVKLRLCTGLPITIKNPPMHELPVFEYSLRELFRLLGARNAMDIFSCMLFERQILLLSSDYYRLMLVAEGLSSLLFPFAWPHAYVPILPLPLIKFLEAPFPFLMGIHYRNQIDKSKLSLLCEPSVCFVDIDSGTVDLPEDLLPIPFKQEMIDEIENFVQESSEKFSNRSLLKYSSSSMFSIAIQDCIQLAVLNNNSADLGTKDRCIHAKDTDNVKMQNQSNVELLSGSQKRCCNWSSALEKLENERKEESVRVLLEEQCNASLRGLFLNYFVRLLAGFEAFIFQEESDQMKDTGCYFDKSAFLNVQNKDWLPFYSSFLESQMFASYIESEYALITCNRNHMIFMNKIKMFHKHSLELSIASFVDEPLSESFETDSTEIEISVSINESCKNATSEGHVMAGQGLECKLNEVVLNSGPFKVCTRKVELPAALGSQSENRQQDVTNRLVVAKVGKDAVNLGLRSIEVEETTLIAGLIELLERIFKHEIMGKLKKSRSSVIWTYLQRYKDTIRTPRSRSSTIAVASCDRKMFKNDISRIMPGQLESGGILEKLVRRSTLLNDLCIIARIDEIETDSGFTRAFIRLCLEKKCLSDHFRELLYKCDFIRQNYKDNAFVVGEEEREQFLYHLLSLNAVDFFCFTDYYLTFDHMYRIVIINGKEAHAVTSAKCWLKIFGSHRISDIVNIPQEQDVFEITHMNLGRLTKMLIGHDNSGFTPAWYLEEVFVQDITTLQVYRFSYNQWIIKGEDSLHKEADGEVVSWKSLSNETLKIAARHKSYDTESDRNNTRVLIQDNNGDVATVSKNEIVNVNIKKLQSAINRVLQLPVSSTQEYSRATDVLCEEDGLCSIIEMILMDGRKKFRQTSKLSFSHIWSYFEKASRFSRTLPSQVNRVACNRFIYLINLINREKISVNNDLKFQMLICIGAKEKLLSDWLYMLHRNHITTPLYEKQSLIRNSDAIKQMMQELDRLNDCVIVLESYLVQGID
ncbi:DENN domain-containing protein 5A [Trichoplax sp. H2]|nr:DENN domain-containing protein 5A [Trichoplax sp. H2]|eukprot:RDD41175.1 DENN domain-containing protein 5A [Trichoplax sp. H2]